MNEKQRMGTGKLLVLNLILFIILLLTVGPKFSTYLLSCVFLSFITLHYIDKLKSKSRYYSGWILRYTKLALVVFLLSIIIMQFAMYNHSDGYIDSGDNFDYMIVLGAKLNGRTPMLALSERLEKAAELYHQTEGLKVIVSGGQGPDELISEADAMGKELSNAGVDERDIIYEDESRSTYENISFSKDIIELRKGDSSSQKIIIVTNSFHTLRAEMVAKRLGLNAEIVAARTPWQIVFDMGIREYFAIMKYFVLGGE